MSDNGKDAADRKVQKKPGVVRIIISLLLAGLALVTLYFASDFFGDDDIFFVIIFLMPIVIASFCGIFLLIRPRRRLSRAVLALAMAAAVAVTVSGYFIARHNITQVKPAKFEETLVSLDLPQGAVLRTASGYDSWNLGASCYPWAAALVESDSSVKQLGEQDFGSHVDCMVLTASDYFGYPLHPVIGEKLGIDQDSVTENQYIIILYEYARYEYSSAKW